jgi:glycosyltransferase involved in cell wall biosynthesis
LAEALKQVLPAYPGVRAVFVGPDTDSAPGGSMSGYIRRELGDLAARAIFVGGVRREKTREYYRSATLTVVPSLQEAFGYTCAEALSCGTAVVASNTGGLAEMIIDGRNGCLFPPGDAKALADLLIELLRDRARLDALGRNARRFAVEHLGSESIARVTLALYEEIISRASGSGRTSTILSNR